LGSSEFCIFGNQSFLQNSTIANTTNITGPTPAGFAAVIIPQIDLSIIPSDDFRGLVNNVTHVTAKMTAKELGLSGLFCILCFAVSISYFVSLYFVETYM